MGIIELVLLILIIAALFGAVAVDSLLIILVAILFVALIMRGRRL